MGQTESSNQTFVVGCKMYYGQAQILNAFTDVCTLCGAKKTEDHSLGCNVLSLLANQK